MRHEYVDIPAQPQPLQEMFWERQRLAARIGEAALALTAANREYNALIVEMIQLNERINQEEQHVA